MRVLVTCEGAHKIDPYLAALVAAGFSEADLQVIYPDAPDADWQALGAQADGLLLCGGPDVEPWRYDQEPLPGVELDLLPRLDEIELGVLAGARTAGKPAWCVCRGLQVLNVFLGGSLYQDLPSQHPSTVTHRLSFPKDALAHSIELMADHPLGELLASGSLQVNSRHHQAVERLGEGLAVIATSPDGVVEAAALPAVDAWWARGVQWHPENLLKEPAQLALFTSFAQVVQARAVRGAHS